MSSSEAREYWRGKRTKIITDFCAKYGMSVNPLNNGYQLRIENLVDIYPTNGRYCILQSGERGGWHNYNDLKELMLRVIPAHGIKTYDVRRGEQPISGIELTGVNKVTEIPVFVPEADTAYLRGVRTMDVAKYNKWYRRAWRWLRRVK